MGDPFDRVWDPSADMTDPLRWRKPGRVRVRVAIDLFGEDVHCDDTLRAFLVMASSSGHTFQILTKRPDRMCELLQHWLRPSMQIADAPSLRAPQWPIPNVWLGVSAEDQRTADERIPLLLATPAAKRFVSAEPLLGPVDFSSWMRGNDADRGHCVSGGHLWRASDRSRRNDLEASGSQGGPMEGRIAHDPVRATPSRESDGDRLPSSARDDGRQAASCASAPHCVPTLQGADPCRTDDQSHQRQAIRQSPREPRDSHALGAEVARHQGSRSAPGTELPALSWLIVGGESGPGARPCAVEWVRSIVRQCADAKVACFVKQLGENVNVTGRADRDQWPAHVDGERADPNGCPHIYRLLLRDRKGADPAEWPEDLRVREFPQEHTHG